MVMERKRGTAPKKSPEAGFTLVEMIVAILILTIGLLGLAGTTGYVVRQTALADATTERAMALQTAVEAVRAQSYASVGSGTRTIGSFQVSWSVVANTGQSKTVEVVTVGPGASSSGGVPGLRDQVADTLSFRRMNY